MNNDSDAFFSVFFISLGIGLSVGTFVSFVNETGNIKSGKDFILGNATYKCTKTNELKGRNRGEE